MRTFDLIMTKTEVKPITLEVTDLQAAETVTDASAVHTPPSGAALTINPTVETPYVNALLGPFGVVGTHHVKIQAEGSNGSKPEVIYQIKVIT